MFNNIDKLLKKIIVVTLIATSLIYLYTAGFGLFSALTQRALLITLLCPTVFLTYELKFKGKANTFTKIIDYLMMSGFLVSGIYILVVWRDRMTRAGTPPFMDIVMGSIMIILILEITRRVAGKFLTLTAGLFLIYALFGPYFPTLIAHRGETWSRLVTFMYTTTEGIFGIPLGIAATFIIVFVIFGAFLESFGGGQWFVDASYAIAGRFRGGPAKSAILASGLMGMISGAPAANVATTGAFTIPLMKKTGYKPHEAAAIEAVASTGGIFTPPIMGAAAFIIAEYVRIPYSSVVVAAIVPAFLFYLALMLTADARAIKNNSIGLPSSELPNLKDVMRERGQFAIPLVFLVGAIMMGWSPMRAGFWSIIIVLAVSFAGKLTRPAIKDILIALEKGSRQVIPIVCACATAGLIVGVISITGLGAKLSYTMINLAAGNLYLAAIITAVIAIILGCGMPPTAVYVIMATVLAPPLIQLGAQPLPAHLFIFMFSALGALTPPVAITAYTGAAIANSDPNKTGLTAFRFGLTGYVIPFMFLISPAVILQGDTTSIMIDVTSALVGILCLVASLEGFFIKSWLRIPRVLLGISSVILLYPGITTDILGIATITIAIIANKFLEKKKDYESMII